MKKIDPVRFIGNFSSGKMGCCIANELIMQGANVELILGPSSESVNENINLNRVVSSRNARYLFKKYEKQDIIIFSAAVSDYKSTIIHTKIKKKMMI